MSAGAILCIFPRFFFFFKTKIISTKRKISLVTSNNCLPQTKMKTENSTLEQDYSLIPCVTFSSKAKRSINLTWKFLNNIFLQHVFWQYFLSPFKFKNTVACGFLQIFRFSLKFGSQGKFNFSVFECSCIFEIMFYAVDAFLLSL